MNPTVEEASEDAGANSNANMRGSSAENQQMSWSEIFSRHESILSSHLDLLNSVKDQVLSDGETFRVVSLMADKTNKLMTQFEVVKKQLGKNTNVFGAMWGQNPSSEPRNGHSQPESIHTGDAQSRPATQSNLSNGKKKRSRRSQDSVETDANDSTAIIAETTRSSKRKRLDLAIPGNDEDVRTVTPVPMDTEDISEEVQRRLQIKEEKRKKRNSKPEKRKRDSLASNASASSVGERSKPRKKKMRVETAQGEDQNNGGSGGKGKSRRRQSDQSEPNSVAEVKTKKQKHAT